ncbi:NAD-P-binding protein [Trametes coccinea BRFM310]|uniref:D-xylose 1-dehydrogenase (NADP(+), D-xylono-1,5-lactone-forming) n=1 Tax=Trametes coccinea (strain BRFM310) TaxID=1353009 RepID=A0A1Y2IZK6_TRAC3|nr:NAD-P-binding protein [Trametes coccinea BRFM310]
MASDPDPGNLPAPAETASTPIRFGILGAARIGPNALLKPAQSHPEVTIAAVACRDAAKGARYAKQWNIPKTYAGPKAYNELLADPEIDAVYIPLPNGAHYAWSIRALEAGKHVLIEKPMTSTAEEAREIFALAEQKGLVALEAMHSTFHPAAQRVREIVLSGELGKVKSVNVAFGLPAWISQFMFEKNDVRFDYNLAGGCAMDMGVYPIAAIRNAIGLEVASLEVASATAVPHPADPDRIDRAMHATYNLPNSMTAETTIDFAIPGKGPFGLIPRLPQLTLSVHLEGGDIEFFNFVAPHMYHSIKVKPKRGSARTEKVYRYADGRDGKGWTTYRYQLQAFVDKIRGRKPWVWIEATTSITEMEVVEKVYEKSGLPPRRSQQIV